MSGKNKHNFLSFYFPSAGGYFEFKTRILNASELLLYLSGFPEGGGNHLQGSGGYGYFLEPHNKFRIIKWGLAKKNQMTSDKLQVFLS